MESIITEQFNHILQINLNRPDKLNALNPEVIQHLKTILSAAQEDKKIRAILITGNGKAFCAGADISQLVEADATRGYQFAKAGQELFSYLENLNKPVLAAINGYAFGGGCELMMAATLRIATPTAEFSQPEVKLGVIPGFGGTQRLSRLVGKGRALDLCVTGRRISAETALAWGLINEITPADRLIERGHEILHHIAELSPCAVALTMKAIHEGADLALPQALELEALLFSQACASEDKKEGVAAFLEKRKAQFS